ncbi:hypothetical protein Btru_052535 [Bulinus truncatus]|nr:hypothetical protein Btru_052535 [Bulinus truncatus]
MDTPSQGYTADIKRVVSEALQKQLDIKHGSTQSAHPYVNRTYYNFKPRTKPPDTESDLNVSITSQTLYSPTILPSDSTRLSFPTYWNIEDLEPFRSNRRPLPLPKNSEYRGKAESPRNNFFKFQRLSSERGSPSRPTSININSQEGRAPWRKILLASIITAVAITCILLLFIVLLAVGVIGPSTNKSTALANTTVVLHVSTVSLPHTTFYTASSEQSIPAITTLADRTYQSLQAETHTVFQPTETQHVTFPRIVIGNDQLDTIEWVKPLI